MREIRIAPPRADKIKTIEEEMKLPDPVELKTEKDFVDFWATFWRNNGLDSEGNDDRKKRELELATKTVYNLALFPSRYRYFGVRDSERMIATGSVEIKIDNKWLKHGYLNDLTVDEKYRGKGVAKKITDLCDNYAKEVGCDYLDGSVDIDNPIALVTKLNDGYLVTGIELTSFDELDLGLFKISKSLKRESGFDKKNGTNGNLVEENLSNLRDIEDLLTQGYVGIDIKNIGSKDDNDPKKWVLILEKSK